LIVPMELPVIYVLGVWNMRRQFELFDLGFCLTSWGHAFMSLLMYEYCLDVSKEAKDALMAHDETVDLV
jgi:hypothetical protein